VSQISCGGGGGCWADSRLCLRRTLHIPLQYSHRRHIDRLVSLPLFWTLFATAFSRCFCCQLSSCDSADGSSLHKERASSSAAWSTRVDQQRRHFVCTGPVQERTERQEDKQKEHISQKRWWTSTVVIPYVGGLSEATERIFRKYGISTAVKPYKTLRNLLVDSKDKHTVVQTGECAYKIPCHNCSSTYIGETGRIYGKKQEEVVNVLLLTDSTSFLCSSDEHRKEVESVSNRTLTRAERKELATESNKSAITDHVAKENHVIDWSGAKILDRESHRKTRQLREYPHMQGGQLYEQRWGSLRPTYDIWPFLVTCSSATSREKVKRAKDEEANGQGRKKGKGGTPAPRGARRTR